MLFHSLLGAHEILMKGQQRPICNAARVAWVDRATQIDSQLLLLLLLMHQLLSTK